MGIAMTRGVVPFAVMALLSLGGCEPADKVCPKAVAGLVPSGTVTMSQAQVAFGASAGGGAGTLRYRGEAYPFAIGNVGLGAIGFAALDVSGEVYKLYALSDFPGVYAQARFGGAFGTKGGGVLWLANESGVILCLQGTQKGLMLSLGGDAIALWMQEKQD